MRFDINVPDSKRSGLCGADWTRVAKPPLIGSSYCTKWKFRFSFMRLQHSKKRQLAGVKQNQPDMGHVQIDFGQ